MLDWTTRVCALALEDGGTKFYFVPGSVKLGLPVIAASHLANCTLSPDGGQSQVKACVFD